MSFNIWVRYQNTEASKHPPDFVTTNGWNSWIQKRHGREKGTDCLIACSCDWSIIAPIFATIFTYWRGLIATLWCRTTDGRQFLRSGTVFGVIIIASSPIVLELWLYFHQSSKTLFAIYLCWSQTTNRWGTSSTWKWDKTHWTIVALLIL